MDSGMIRTLVAIADSPTDTEQTALNQGEGKRTHLQGVLERSVSGSLSTAGTGSADTVASLLPHRRIAAPSTTTALIRMNQVERMKATPLVP